MHHPPDPLPLLPAELLRRHNCAEPTDTRFRAVARLRQSLWREQHGYPCGRYVDANGRPRRLGSRVSYRVGRTGVNLIDPALVPLVRTRSPIARSAPSSTSSVCGPTSSPLRRSPSISLAR